MWCLQMNIQCKINVQLFAPKHKYVNDHLKPYVHLQCTSRISKRRKRTQRTYKLYKRYTTYVKYVNNLITVDYIFFRLFFFCFHLNKFQVLDTPKKSEWLYPERFRTVILKHFFTIFDALVWYCEELIYLLVTDISMGVEWLLCFLLKGIFMYIC